MQINTDVYVEIIPPPPATTVLAGNTTPFMYSFVSTGSNCEIRVTSLPNPGPGIYPDNIYVSQLTAVEQVPVTSNLINISLTSVNLKTTTTTTTCVSVEEEGYRWGFNGQERDDEVSGTRNAYTAEFWEYDPRLGRRWNTDPVVKVWESPYACFESNPIAFSDPDGDDVEIRHRSGSSRADKFKHKLGVHLARMFSSSFRRQYKAWKNDKTTVYTIWSPTTGANENTKLTDYGDGTAVPTRKGGANSRTLHIDFGSYFIRKYETRTIQFTSDGSDLAIKYSGFNFQSVASAGNWNATLTGRVSFTTDVPRRIAPNLQINTVASDFLASGTPAFGTGGTGIYTPLGESLGGVALNPLLSSQSFPGGPITRSGGEETLDYWWSGNFNMNPMGAAFAVTNANLVYSTFNVKIPRTILGIKRWRRMSLNNSTFNIPNAAANTNRVYRTGRYKNF